MNNLEDNWDVLSIEDDFKEAPIDENFKKVTEELENYDFSNHYSNQINPESLRYQVVGCEMVF
ncbi:MAG: hypothetical protein KC516_02200 [Nanoarchaeota archaeon]|nr:hypothetical protein [Nanoarchaeota archaeon]